MLLFLALASGIYYFFWHGLRFLNADNYFGQSLLYFVYEMYLLILIFLVAMSTMINGLFRFFKSDDDAWVASTPRFDVITTQLFLNASWHALWPFLIIALPLIFALHKALNLSLLGLIINITSAALLTILITSASLIALIALAYLIKIINKYLSFVHLNIKTLAIAVFIFVSLLLLSTVSGGLQNDLVQMFEAKNLSQGQAGIEAIIDNFKFLPSHLLASSLYYWQTDNTLSMLNYHAELWFFAIILLGLWFYCAPRLINLWTAFRTNDQTLAARQQNTTAHIKKPARFIGGIYHSLVKKEAIVFYRNSRGLMWFSFLLFFWIIQTMINISLSNNIQGYDLDISSTPTLVQAIQILTAVYFISAFALRFVFPAFSQERRTLWILSSAPIDWKKVFYAKLVFYNLLFLFIGLLIAYINLTTLLIPGTVIAETMFLFFIMIIFIVTLSLSLGMIFPNFETDNPSALGTSLPGLFLIFISLLSGGLSVWTFYLKLIGFSNIYYYSFLTLLIIALVTLVLIAPRRYAKLDKVKVID